MMWTQTKKPLRRADRGLPAQIAAEFGRRITRGELLPGETLPRESELLAVLNVSRTTLREAMKILSAKGFIEARPKLGTCILPQYCWNLLDPVVLSWHDDPVDQKQLVSELFEIRLAIEPVAARLAAERRTDEDLGNIRRAFAAMTGDTQDERDAIEADIAFHLSIIAAARNRFMMPISTVIRSALTISIPATMEVFGGLQHSIALHGDILDAIQARDPDKASKTARVLIEATYVRNFTGSVMKSPV